MKKIIINFLRKIVAHYDTKNCPSDNVFYCTNYEVRNRYKRKEYKIPENKPQCPIYHDNRCCGSCDFAPGCDHAVDCGCYGYTKARLGGNDWWKVKHKASEYYGVGRCNADGVFDWEYYNRRKEAKS